MLEMLAALLPLFTDSAKMASRRWLAPEKVKPVNVEELVELQKVDIERLKAVAAIADTGPSYPWVAAVRALQRPVVILITLSVWVYGYVAGFPPGIDQAPVNSLAASVFFYLFGDRVNTHINKQ